MDPEMTNHGLKKDWVFSPAIDLELKHYTLLAYLQKVRNRFMEHKLYPHLEELRSHLDELLRMRSLKEELKRNMHGELLGFDPRTGHALYERPVDDELLTVIDSVIDIAVPDMHRMWVEGVDLRRRFAEKIRFEPVGIQPLQAHEGWLLLRNGSEARVYNYAMPLFREHQEDQQYRSVVTHYFTSYAVSVSWTYEGIKADLLKREPRLPAPATFVFETEHGLPYIETFMPLAKQLVYEHIMGRT